MVEKAVQLYAKLGYTHTLGELSPGVNAAAVPLGVPDSREVVCLMCGGPANILTQELISERVGPKLVKIAQDYPISAF
jgi:DNA-binding IclR family transcriptional regulator